MNSGDPAAEIFELMQRLIEIRYDKPLHHQIMKAADYSMLSAVTLLNGSSFDKDIISTIRNSFGPGKIGLFIFDADANVRRDLDCYGDRLADGCWIVIDDYISATNKAGPTREQVDELNAEGRLRPLGVYGWGTWVGRWVSLL